MSSLNRGMGRALMAAAALSMASMTGEARATGSLSLLLKPEEQAKLDAYPQARDGLLAAARAGASAEQGAALDAVLAGERLPLTHPDTLGAWRCRFIKLGGEGPPVAVFPWYGCRIDDDGVTWLRKLGGSERTSGELYTSGSSKKAIYLGVRSLPGDRQAHYGEAPPQREQIAVVVRPGPNRLRFEFPWPKDGPAFEILEMERR